MRHRNQLARCPPRVCVEKETMKLLQRANQNVSVRERRRSAAGISWISRVRKIRSEDSFQPQTSNSRQQRPRLTSCTVYSQTPQKKTRTGSYISASLTFRRKSCLPSRDVIYMSPGVFLTVNRTSAAGLGQVNLQSAVGVRGDGSRGCHDNPLTG